MVIGSYFGRIILLVLVYSLSWVDLLAYSKKNHALLTVRAIKEFNLICGNHEFDTISRSVIQDIAKASKAEDNRLEKLRKQHFYKTNSELPDFRLFIKRFRKLSKELDSMLQDTSVTEATIYTQLGHLIHYLQDMTVPAHVVPVYHSAGSAKNPFDQLKIKEFSYPLINDDQFESLFAFPIMSLEKILDTTAHTTMSSLKTNLEIAEVTDNDTVNIENKTWLDYFWNWQGGRKKGFGRYGAFKKEYGQSSLEYNGTKYYVAQNTYDRFSTNQLREAQNATILAIIYVQRELEKRDDF